MLRAQKWALIIMAFADRLSMDVSNDHGTPPPGWRASWSSSEVERLSFSGLTFPGLDGPVWVEHLLQRPADGCEA